MAAATATAPRPRRSAPAWTRHSADELTFAHQDGDVYHFTAPSASTPGKLNAVAYDATTREALCDCVHTPRPKRDGSLSVCWHAHHAEGAYLLHLCRATAAGLDDAALVLAGKQAKKRVETAAWWWAAHSALDAPMLQACREEWKRRRAARAAAPADLAAYRAKRRAAAGAFDTAPPAA